MNFAYGARAIVVGLERRSFCHAEPRRERASDPGRARHADGRADAPLLGAGVLFEGAARTRLPADPRHADVREPGRVPRHDGAGGPRRRALPAPHGVDVLRPQRGMRAALRLSRLEVRRRRQLRRHAVGAGRFEFQAQGQDQGLPVHRARRRGVDLYGTGGAEAGIPRPRMDHGAGLAPLPHPPHAGVQLAAGGGRRVRHQPPRLPAQGHACRTTA